MISWSILLVLGCFLAVLCSFCFHRHQINTFAFQHKSIILVAPWPLFGTGFRKNHHLVLMLLNGYCTGARPWHVAKLPRINATAHSINRSSSSYSNNIQHSYQLISAHKIPTFQSWNHLYHRVSQYTTTHIPRKTYRTRYLIYLMPGGTFLSTLTPTIFSRL